MNILNYCSHMWDLIKPKKEKTQLLNAIIFYFFILKHNNKLDLIGYWHPQLKFISTWPNKNFTCTPLGGFEPKAFLWSQGPKRGYTCEPPPIKYKYNFWKDNFI